MGAAVCRERAERFRKVLFSLGLAERSVEIVEAEGDVVIPLVSEPEQALLYEFGARLVEAEFPPRECRVDPIDEIRARSELPGELTALLPRKWERLGDVLVLRLDPRLDGHERGIGELYATVLGTKAVLRDVGGVSGEYRTPAMRRLYGDDTVAIHLENGLLYKFDVERIMFSSGNNEERLRMGTVDCSGETVVDMFAGIGYFSLPLAKYGGPDRLIACEINELAHSYLVENVGINDVEGVVEPILGDNRSLAGDGIADRVVMGYVRTTHEYLSTALRLVKDGGTIHYHETCPLELLPYRPLDRLKEAAAGVRVDLLRFKEIKSYSPGVSHVVLDVQVFKRA